MIVILLCLKPSVTEILNLTVAEMPLSLCSGLCYCIWGYKFYGGAHCHNFFTLSDKTLFSPKTLVPTYRAS
jgi:hypothetical protein